MSRLDEWAARWARFGVYDTHATTSAAATAVVEVGQQTPALLDTTFADTVESVEAAELEVIGELHELVTSWRLSPWQAAFALFNPISEEATDVA